MIFSLWAVLILPVWSHAGEPFKKGTWELGVGVVSPGFLVSPFISYFFKDHLQGILHLGLSYAKDFENSGGSSTLKGFSGRVSTGMNYNFVSESKLVPVLGANVFYFYAESEQDSQLFNHFHVYGMEGLLGLRYRVAGKSSVNLNLIPTLIAWDNKDSFGGSFRRIELDLGLSYSLFF